MSGAAAAKGSRPPGGGLVRWLVTALLVVWAFVLGVMVGQGNLATPEQVARVAEFMGLDRWLMPEPSPQHQGMLKPRLQFYRSVESRDVGLAQAGSPEAEQAQPEAMAPAEARGQYSVQVASFKEEAQARSLASTLEDLGHRAYYKSAMVRGVGLRFRVRVGPFAKREEAQTAAGRIRLQQRLAAYVTQEE